MMIGMVVIFALATTSTNPADDKPEAGPMEVVVHANFPESGIQGAGPMNILQDSPDTLVEVVCQGAGIGLVEEARTDHAEAVEALIKEGVKFVACVDTMRQGSIKAGEFLPGVGTVPLGAVEVVCRRPKHGYADFEP